LGRPRLRRPARVSGSAGTGKTIVALHRAAQLARTHPEARVLLATSSDTLANALRTKLKRLVGNEPRLAERIDVHSLNALGLRLYKAHYGPVKLASRDNVQELLRAASQAIGGHKFSLHFLITEWEQVVDAWQLQSWEAYRDVARLGRKTRLPEAQRAVLWSIFEQVRHELLERDLMTQPSVFTALASAVAESRNPPFDFAVVDGALSPQSVPPGSSMRASASLARTKRQIVVIYEPDFGILRHRVEIDRPEEP
jgi:superfamily I DNA/RNA helicase